MNFTKLINTITLSGISEDEAVGLAVDYCNSGADALVVLDISISEEDHERNISIMSKIIETIDIPVFTGGSVKKIGDVKRYLQTGAKKVILDFAKSSNNSMLSDAVNRFGGDRIAVKVYEDTADIDLKSINKRGAGLIITSNPANARVSELPVILTEVSEVSQINAHKDDEDDVYGIIANDILIMAKYKTLNELKYDLKKLGVNVNSLGSSIPFSEFKLNDAGLIPAIVQDYKNGEVLMLAYMNEESYNQTIKTGIMTYYSRSRQELWEKGLTSGHFQYVKSLALDCDNDTLLAKVYQVGAACHTGRRSCFFKQLTSRQEE